jgi:hypothetical protein
MTYLVFLLQMSRAKALIKPVGLGGRFSDHVAAVGICISVMGTNRGGSTTNTGSDRFSLEIKGTLNHFTHTRHHARGGFGRLHETGHGLARVVHVLNVGTTKGGSTLVYINGVSVWLQEIKKESKW